MTVVVNKEKCNGCGECKRLCPGDLMELDSDGKAFIRNPEDCWDRMVCVKACPVQALEIRLPFSIADYEARMQAKRLKNGALLWSITRFGEEAEKLETKGKRE